MSRATKRCLKLWLGWTILFAVIIGGFWGTWYAIAGTIPSVSMVSTAANSQNGSTLALPIAISRGWDVAMAPFIALFLIIFSYFFYRLSQLSEDAIGACCFIGGLGSFFSFFQPIVSPVAIGIMTIGWVAHVLTVYYDANEFIRLDWRHRAGSIAFVAITSGVAAGISQGLTVGLAFGVAASVVMPLVAMGLFGVIVGVMSIIKFLGLAVAAVWSRVHKGLGIPSLVNGTAALTDDLAKDRVRDYLDKRYEYLENPSHGILLRDVKEQCSVPMYAVEEVVKEFRERDHFLRLENEGNWSKAVLWRRYY